jgi:membrane protease YdiL (CAAX protease family)
MVGIIVELIISWLLLWFICNKHLSVLGFRPTKERVINLCIGLVIAASCCTLYQIMTTAFIENSWVLNKQVTGKTILESSRWTLVSVIYEELIFRGALLYIAIKKLGVTKACIVSAVGFGIYHWFTFNVFGNPFMMAITFLMTAIVGLSWAFAFAKTGSLYLPIGLHFGWNLFCTVVFSNGNFMQGILVRTNGTNCKVSYHYSFFCFKYLLYHFLLFYISIGFQENKTLLQTKSNILLQPLKLLMLSASL